MNKIYVVTHKKVKRKLQEPYEYIQVGKYFSNDDYGYLSDDIGDNISFKNKNYCELTALYWIWKNKKEIDNVGICHYRRFFTNNYYINSEKLFINNNDINKILKKYDIIVPKKEKFKKSTVREHYSTFNGFDRDLDTTRKAILKLYPEYIDAFDYIMKSNKAFYLNMFITSKKKFDEYCEWLFTILEYVESNTDISEYSIQEARIFGYISELLLNVWVKKNNLRYKQKAVINVESSIFWRVKQKLLS